jgi:inosose dehydratase
MTNLATASTLSFLPKTIGAENIRHQFPISCNTYNWTTFFRRQGLTWGEDLDQSIGQFSKSGIKAIEPAFNTPEEVTRLLPYLTKYDLTMPSAYVNSLLHEPAEADQSIVKVMAIADALQKSNTKILVTNPSPIQWGAETAKNDLQIKLQTEKLDLLGKNLHRLGMTLAYHTHDIELLAGAKEFHHVLQNTNPEYVSFCLDAHWVFRGCKNSDMAVFDVIQMYGDRIVELHIRQSKEGIWREVFGEGDIDYPRMAQVFSERNITPHLVIEQAVENGTPDTLTAVEAHVISLKQVQKTFSTLLN